LTGYNVLGYNVSSFSTYAIFCPESTNCLAYNVLPALLAYSRLSMRAFIALIPAVIENNDGHSPMACTGVRAVINGRHLLASPP